MHAVLVRHVAQRGQPLDRRVRGILPDHLGNLLRGDTRLELQQRRDPVGRHIHPLEAEIRDVANSVLICHLAGFQLVAERHGDHPRPQTAFECGLRRSLGRQLRGWYGCGQGRKGFQ